MTKTAQDWEPTFVREAVQLRAVELFYRNFIMRYPNGVVRLGEYEYLGLAAGGVSPNPPGMRLSGDPKLGVNRVLGALQTDFRNPGGRNRKPDGMGISRDGRQAELVEVTVARRKLEVTTQLNDELAILRGRVNAVSGIATNWRGTDWRPAGPDEMFYQPYPRVTVSFEPTYRESAPPGIILYEVFDRRRREELETA